MIKVVIDTNVVISGLGWGGKPKEILDLIRESKIILCVSEGIIAEYWDVLSRGIIPKEEEARMLFISIIEERKIILVKPKEHFDSVKEDPDDNIFLDCGMAGNVEYIITGDAHLLKLKKFRGIKILSPSRFLEIYKKVE